MRPGLAIVVVLASASPARADTPPSDGVGGQLPGTAATAPMESTAPPESTAAQESTAPPTSGEQAAPLAGIVRGSELVRGPRLVLDLEVFASERIVRRAGPDLTELRLDRAEAGAAFALGPWARAGLRLEAVRSAANGGALGIDGDSLVLRVKRAELAGARVVRGVRFDAAIGAIGDPWIDWLDAGYTLRPLSPTASERLLGWSPSDLAIRIGAGYGPVHAAVTVGNGEGLRYPERNNGQTTTAVLELVAIDRPHARLAVAGMARDGSVGPALVRDRRVGGGLALSSPRIRAGAELVRAWGIGERGDLVGTALGGWLEASLYGPLIAGVRGATLGYMDGRASTFGGAIAVEPWHDHEARLRLWLAIDRTTASGAGAPLPGADPGDATTVLLLASATAPYVIP